MKRLLFFICVLHCISAYSQEKRLALVIGNSAYAMKQVLSDIGFDVLEYYNLNQGDMKKAIDDFGVELRRYDMGLFFYAGHGLSVRCVKDTPLSKNSSSFH